MPSTAATSMVMPLWVVLLQGLTPILLLLLYKGAQYLIEGQRHRNARQIAGDIRPGVTVRIKDRSGSFTIRQETTGTADIEAATPSPEDEKPPPTDVIPFPSRSGSGPDATQHSHGRDARLHA